MEKKYPQEHRAERGGNYGLDAGRCRSSSRFRSVPGARLWSLGFRPVAEVKEDVRIRALRSGCWFLDICRSAFRDANAPGTRGNTLGFRPVAEVKEDVRNRVLRGGSWFDFAWDCRLGLVPGNRGGSLGFRPVADSVTPQTRKEM
jgi:hypothetical protein